MDGRLDFTVANRVWNTRFPSGKPRNHSNVETHKSHHSNPEITATQPRKHQRRKKSWFLGLDFLFGFGILRNGFRWRRKRGFRWNGFLGACKKGRRWWTEEEDTQKSSLLNSVCYTKIESHRLKSLDTKFVSNFS